MANKPHKSVGNERDELFALLKEASFTYRKEVIGESKLYELYVEDFLNGHYYSDHRDAAGKNRHRKNIGILRGILKTITLNSEGTPGVKKIQQPLSWIAKPQAVPTGLSIISALAGIIACLRLLSDIGRPREAK